MAQRVNIILTDDLDGTEATETVNFGLDGYTYEIDLNDKNAKALRKALDKFVGHGRKVRDTSRRVSRSASASSTASTRDYNPAEVREWATANGHTVPARGRIPATVLDAYRAAH
jgi:hypothetical protein